MEQDIAIEMNDVEENDGQDCASFCARAEYNDNWLEREENNGRRVSALSLLKLKEKGRVPQTVVDYYVDSATEVVQASIGRLKSRIQNSLEGSGINFNAVAGLAELFESDSIITKPFLGIENE